MNCAQNTHNEPGIKRVNFATVFSHCIVKRPISINPKTMIMINITFAKIVYITRWHGSK